MLPGKSDIHMITHMYTHVQISEVRSGTEVGERSLEFHTYEHITELVDFT